MRWCSLCMYWTQTHRNSLLNLPLTSICCCISLMILPLCQCFLLNRRCTTAGETGQSRGRAAIRGVNWWRPDTTRRHFPCHCAFSMESVSSHGAAVLANLFQSWVCWHFATTIIPAVVALWLPHCKWCSPVTSAATQTDRQTGLSLAPAYLRSLSPGWMGILWAPFRWYLSIRGRLKSRNIIIFCFYPGIGEEFLIFHRHKCIKVCSVQTLFFQWRSCYR